METNPPEEDEVDVPTERVMSPDEDVVEDPVSIMTLPEFSFPLPVRESDG